MSRCCGSLGGLPGALALVAWIPWQLSLSGCGSDSSDPLGGSGADAAAPCGGQLSITATTGAWAHGQEVVISGAAFGIKDPAAPLLWDDFEDGSVGQQVTVDSPIHGSYNARCSSWSSYADADVYAGALAFHERRDDSTDWFNGLGIDWVPIESRDVFGSMKIKLTCSTGGLLEPSCKMFRLSVSDPDIIHGYPNYVIGLRGGYPGYENRLNIGASAGTAYDTIPGDYQDQWVSVSMYARASDRDIANGLAGWEWDGEVTHMVDQPTVVSVPEVHSGYRAVVFAGHMTHVPGHSLDLHMDDVYADSSLARVTLQDPRGGNVEMQIPQAWSCDEITVRVNTGRYAPGAELDLRVYDSEGIPSDPYRITLAP